MGMAFAFPAIRKGDLWLMDTEIKNAVSALSELTVDEKSGIIKTEYSISLDDKFAHFDIWKGLVIKWMPPTDYNTARSIRKTFSD